MAKKIKSTIPEYQGAADLRTAVDDACANGRIDEKSRILHYLYILFDRKKLSREFRPLCSKPVKSGTLIWWEIEKYVRSRDGKDDVSETARRYVAAAFPDLDKTYLSPAGFFRLHYTLEGTNAVSSADYNNDGIPDYIEKTAAAFDNVMHITCDRRGFKKPLTDDRNGIFDVYIYDLKGVYGITSTVSYYKDALTGAATASCRISIDNNYASSKGYTHSRDNCMRVTAAHEFFHAVQFAYNTDADNWWKEASATWNEDEIYDSVNDYFRYLKEMFNSPEKPLSQKSYGAVVFAKYLSEKLGGYSTVKKVLELQTKYSDSFKAIDAAIRSVYPNKDIGTAFNEFSAYNFRPSQYYIEGSQWNESARIHEVYERYPVDLKNDTVDHMAAKYYLFKVANGEDNDKTLRINVNADGKGRLGIKIQKIKKGTNNCEIEWIDMYGVKSKDIVIERFNTEYSEVCLIPANLNRKSDQLRFSFNAVLELPQHD